MVSVAVRYESMHLLKYKLYSLYIDSYFFTLNNYFMKRVIYLTLTKEAGGVASAFPLLVPQEVNKVFLAILSSPGSSTASLGDTQFNRRFD